MSSPTAVLVLELFQWPQPDSRSAKSDLRTSAVAKLDRVRIKGKPGSPKPSLALSKMATGSGNLPRASADSSSSSSGSASESPDSLRQSSQIGSESESDAESNSGSTDSNSGIPNTKSNTKLIPVGSIRFPLRHLPEDRRGNTFELEGEVVGAKTGAAGVLQEGCHCVIEVQAWDAAQYSAEQLNDHESAQSTAHDSEVSLHLIQSPAYTGHIVSVLTNDLISKQTALDKLQRTVLKAEGSSQLGLWRVHEAEKRNGVLAADLAQLRKLLHEERSSSKVSDIIALSRQIDAQHAFS